MQNMIDDYNNPLDDYRLGLFLYFDKPLSYQNANDWSTSELVYPCRPNQ